MKIRTVCLRPTFYLLALSMIIIATPAGYAAAQVCVPAPSQGISWWPGDGNISDVIGGRHGTRAGSATFGAGKVGQAFSFNGGGWINVPDSPAWTLGTHDFTIEAWAKFNSLAGRDPVIAHDDGGGEENKWIFWYDELGHDKLRGTPALRFHINSPHPGAVPGPHDTVVAPWNPVAGQWYHLAVTRSGSTYSLYINGSRVATDTSTYEIADPSAPLTIGNAESYNLNGLVDEAEIYKRALSATEISRIATANEVGKCKVTIPVPEYGWLGGAMAAIAGIGALAFARKRSL